MGLAGAPQQLAAAGPLAGYPRLVAPRFLDRLLGGEPVVARRAEVAHAELEQGERAVSVDRGRGRALRLAQRHALARVAARALGAAEAGLDLGERAEPVRHQRLL